MYLLVKCIGVFDNRNGMEGFVTEDNRWIWDWSVDGTSWVSPKTDDIGWNVGLGNKFWEGKYKPVSNKYALIYCEFTIEKTGDWLEKLGEIKSLWTNVEEIIEELLK